MLHVVRCTLHWIEGEGVRRCVEGVPVHDEHSRADEPSQSHHVRFDDRGALNARCTRCTSHGVLYVVRHGVSRIALDSPVEARLLPSQIPWAVRHMLFAAFYSMCRRLCCDRRFRFIHISCKALCLFVCLLACVFAWFAAAPPPAVQHRRPLHRDQVCNKTGHHARAFDVLFENDELLRATFWDRKALKPTHVTYSLMLQARLPTCRVVPHVRGCNRTSRTQRCNTVASGRRASRHHAAIDTMQHSDAHSACDARCATQTACSNAAKALVSLMSRVLSRGVHNTGSV